MSETAVLKIKVDSSGAVAGATAAASSLDRVTAAASRSAAATATGSAAFNSYKGNASQVVNSLQAMLREQSGLARAYALGAEAVEKYNLQLKIEAVLTEAGVAANSVRGRVITNQVTQLEALRVANERSAAAAREQAAAASAASGGLQGMAMKAMGASMALAVVVGVLKDFSAAAMEAEENARRLEKAVERKGSTFRMTADDLMRMASEMEALTRFEDDAVQKAQAVLLRFDEVNAGNIEAVTRATLDFAAATGQDASTAAVAFGKALLEPGEGMRALKEVGIALTDQQSAMIEVWNKTGNSAKSVALLVGKMNEKIGGEAMAAAKTGAGALDQFSNALGNLKERLGSGLIPETFVRKAADFLRGIDQAAEQTGASLLDMLLPFTEKGAAFNAALGSARDNMAGLAVEAKNAARDANMLALSALKHPPAPVIPPKTAEELKAAADAAKAYRDRLQEIADKADPFAAKQREMARDVKLLKEAFAVLKVPLADQPRMMAQLTGDWSAYADGLGEVKFELLEVTSALERWQQANAGEGFKTAGVKKPGLDLDVKGYEDAMVQAGRNFTDDLSQGLGQAAASFGREFVETGEINIERLGDMLADTLLSAAQQYFAQMVANQAKLQMANTATGGTTGAGAGSMMGGMGAASSVLMAAAAVYMVYSITDAIREANAAGKFKETAVAGVYSGGIGSTYAGELSEQGRVMAESMRDFLNTMQSVAGQWLTSLPEIGARVSGDGKKFMAMVGGEIIGTFSSMSEAMARAFQAAFQDAQWGGEVEQIIKDMVTNFRGSNIDELKEGLKRTRAMLDEVAGLSDVEIAIRDLPFQASALKQSMVQLGASFEEASALAAKWQATQMSSLRDQITGHQATEAEQRAQKEREALLFNAQLALNQAEIQMKRDKLAADIEILKAGGTLATADLNLTTQYLGGVGRLSEVKADLLNRDLQIQQGHVNLMTAAGQAALASLQLQMAALDQVYAILGAIKPIDLGEIRLPGGGGGGGGVSSGPSEREQRAEAFLDFLEGLRLDGLSGYQRALADLNAAFAEHTQAAAEMEGGEERLAAARRQALADLREDVIDAFGSPMEGLRDRLEEIRQQVSDWYAANNELGAQFQRGEISLQQLLDALAEANVLWAEFGDMARSELLNLALYFTDALGDTEESARIREELAEMEWDFKRLEMQMLIETYEEIGWITAAAADHWRGVLAAIPENRPGNINDTTTGGGSGSLQSAIARLRNAIEALRESNENLLLSDVSPLSTADQFAEAQRLYNETLAAAQGGDLQAIEDFASVRDQYLALAAAMYGTAGGGYQSIFQQSLQAGQDLATAGQAILDAIPPQMAGVEERLDTIAEILAAIEAAQAPVVNPPGSGDGPPTPPGHPLPPRPPHWPDEGNPVPGGGPMGHPPRPGDSQGFAGGGETVSQLRAMNEQLRQLLAATEEQTRSANSNSLRRVAAVGGGRGISVRRGN